jgi:hypothetical protein
MGAYTRTVGQCNDEHDADRVPRKEYTTYHHTVCPKHTHTHGAYLLPATCYLLLQHSVTLSLHPSTLMHPTSLCMSLYFRNKLTNEPQGCLSLNKHIRTYAHTHIRTYTHTHIHTYAHMHSSYCVCASVHIHSLLPPPIWLYGYMVIGLKGYRAIGL